MRNLLISLAWMTGALAVIGVCSWLVIRRYPTALDRIPDDGEPDEMGARPGPRPARPARREDAA
jgi:hypothetical protein